MTERAGYGVKRNYKVLNWEQNDFPILCENCLGESLHVRLLKKHLGEECKLCARPYTTFNWRPQGAKARPRRTEVCSTCAKINNCCQSCVYDLEHNLPIDIRNKLMGDKKVELLVSEGNRDIFTALFEANNQNAELPYQEATMLKEAGELSNPDCDDDAGKEITENKPADLKPEQKELLENIDVAKKVAEGLGNKTVYVRYVAEGEIGLVQAKIAAFFDETAYDVAYDDGNLVVDFKEADDAEKFIKIYGNNMIIKGKKLTISWNKDSTSIYASRKPVEPPSFLPKETRLDQKEIKQLVVNNIDKGVKHN